MDILTFIIVFFFGLLFGSFLNVVVNRYNTGLTVRGRSFCFTCGRTLTWKDLVPLLSFLALRGKCRICKSKISWQYPLVEFLSGLGFMAVFWKTLASYDTYSTLFFFDLTVSLAMFWLLLGLSVYDLKHKIIPNGLVYTFAILALVRMLTLHVTSGAAGTDLLPGLLPAFLPNLLAGPALAAPFAFFWLVSSGRWMGLGDAKLALGMGWLLGGYFGAQAVVLSFWLGALIGVSVIVLGYIIHSPRITRKSEIPFAPFLVVGTCVMFLLEWDMTADVIRLIDRVVFLIL